MDFDWEKIKTDYIADSKSSYRKIAEKYGVSFDTLKYRGKEEGWAKLKEQFHHDVTTKTINKEKAKQINRATRLMNVTDKLLMKIEEAVEELSAEGNIDRTTLRQISGALKDIKDIQGIKSDRDIREQEARIRNLEKQAKESVDKPNEITITIAGGEKTWAE